MQNYGGPHHYLHFSHQSQYYYHYYYHYRCLFDVVVQVPLLFKVGPLAFVRWNAASLIIRTRRAGLHLQFPHCGAECRQIRSNNNIRKLKCSENNFAQESCSSAHCFWRFVTDGSLRADKGQQLTRSMQTTSFRFRIFVYADGGRLNDQLYGVQRRRGRNSRG